MSSAQVSVRVSTGLDRAFRVFTEELGAWWRPHALFASTPRGPGRLALVSPGPQGRLVETLDDGRSFELGRVLTWEPPTRVRFSWRPASLSPGQATEVDVAFQPVGDAVRVTVTHRGWERVPAEHAARHGAPDALLLRRLGEWWAAQLDRYKSGMADADATP